jgi:ATP/ADP translocase
MGSISLCSPYIAMILSVIFAAWIYSVFFVAKEFNEKSKEASAPIPAAE